MSSSDLKKFIRVASFGVDDKLQNFGDELSGLIISRILGVGVQPVDISDPLRAPSLIGIGSVLHLVKSGDFCWGVGSSSVCKLPRLDGVSFLATRGPLTADRIRKAGGNCGDVFGDPGILLNRLYSVTVSENTNFRKDEIVVVPHYAHIRFLAAKIRIGLLLQKNFHLGRSFLLVGSRLARSRVGGEYCSFLSPFLQPDILTHFIARSKLVVGSSLHALIAAYSFSRPLQWWWPDQFEDKYGSDGRFKYNDFFESIGGKFNGFGRSINECLQRDRLPMMKTLNEHLLIQALQYCQSELKINGIGC